MSAVAAKPVVAKPAKKAAKPKVPAAHPKYTEMIAAAVGSLKERGGSSRVAILKYIVAKYNVGKNETIVNSHLKMALRSGVKSGSLKQAKGTGATGSFRLGEKAKAAPKKAAIAKKPRAPSAAKKTKSPKKVAKKATKSPKKATAKKSVARKPKSPAKAKKAASKVTKPASKVTKPKAAAKKPKAAKPKKVAAKKPAKKA